MLKRFMGDRSGNYAMLLGIMTLPLLLAIGFGVDTVRYVSAKQHLQELADGASLAVAASQDRDETRLRALAGKMVVGNTADNRVENVTVASLDIKDDKVDLGLEGDIHTYFMGLANIHTLDVRASALAVRAVTGSVEVALVLDNTWSMSEKDGKGVSKIDTLKTAAKSLITELMGTKESSVRIGLVPYADYVNVGTKYRSASWLSVPADYDVAAVAPTCEMKTVTESTCAKNAPKYACTKYVDGVPMPSTCGGECIQAGPNKTTTKNVCTGGVNAASYRWFGCVGSRKTGTTRLDDGSPSVTYPGYLATRQACLNPLVPLTSDKDALLTATQAMVIDGSGFGNSGYQPYTYIPAGLIWGLNLLSPTQPFNEGATYDPANITPRKVVVLMTDGDNTLRFQASDGKHVQPSSNAATAATQIAATNQDTASICATMKNNNKIEIFSVAFMVSNADAKTLLEGCATDKDHYYDASDPDKLLAAFSGIAQSLSQVRLAR